MSSYERIDGFEINCNIFDPEEFTFLKDFIRLLKKDDKSIQVHGFHGFQNYYNDIYFLDLASTLYDSLADITEQEIQVVLHPNENADFTIAQNNTVTLIDNLNQIRNMYKHRIQYSLENLNETRYRLNTDKITPVIDQVNVGFCWDIGHEVFENSCKYELNKSMKERLTNVHIHDVKETDHYPFIHGNVDYIKAIDYLMTIGYTGAVVLEINPDLISHTGIYKKYESYMENLNLPHPKQIDRAVPANMRCGKPEGEIEALDAKTWARLSYTFAGIWEISPQAYEEVANKVQLIDVREPREYSGPLGHIKGSRLVPLAELGERSAELDGDRPTVTVCRSGARSAQAVVLLQKAGFSDVANLAGGMLRWRAAGYPVEDGGE